MKRCSTVFNPNIRPSKETPRSNRWSGLPPRTASEAPEFTRPTGLGRGRGGVDLLGSSKPFAFGRGCSKGLRAVRPFGWFGVKGAVWGRMSTGRYW